MYAEPAAYTSKNLEMMHRLCDYDGDGSITKWEQFMASLHWDRDSTHFYTAVDYFQSSYQYSLDLGSYGWK
jgi:hypothetical protein